MQPQHIPAWKRLGFKLKYAKDSNERIQPSAPSPKRDAGGHRSLSDTTTESAVPTKRRRTELQKTPSDTNGYDPKVLSPSFKRINNGGLKKKVSFTAETKQLDGDSSKSLIAAWEAENKFYEDLQAEYAAQAQVTKSTEKTQPTAKMKQPKRKKAMDERSARENEARKAPRKSTDALDYLTQFHQNRESWKFNKTREVWILKHILSLNEIPPSYDDALAKYVQGLKSKAARSRLADQCTEAAAEDFGQAPRSDESMEHSQVIDEDIMDDPERRRTYLDTARERFKRDAARALDEQESKVDKEEQMKYDRKFLRKMRARTLLDNITPLEVSNGGHITNGNIHPRRTVFSDDDPSGELPANRSNNQRKRKMLKKVRSNITISESDSSSSSSSSADESDSSEEEATSRKSSAPGRSKKITSSSDGDGTSSSGPDSSSEDDDASSTDQQDGSDDTDTSTDGDDGG